MKKKDREAKCRALLKYNSEDILFTDEVSFTLNSYNIHAYIAIHESGSHQLFFDDYLNGTTYSGILKNIRDWGNNNLGDKKFILQHDNHPAHTEADNQSFIKKNFKHISTEEWPSESCMLNPDDYLNLTLKDEVYKSLENTEISSHDKAKLLVEQEFNKLMSRPNYVSALCKSFPAMLQCCIANEGGKFTSHQCYKFK